MLPYLLMLQTNSFILRVQIFRIKLIVVHKKIELATENSLVCNKAPAGEKGSTRSTLSIRSTVKQT